ncbi:MAG: T9SS type A sorting domain-containing protein [bacterium]
MQHITHFRQGLLLTLLFVFLFGNEKILAQQKHYPLTVVDTFDLYKKYIKNDSFASFSANALIEQSTYSHLVFYGKNRDLYFYKYGPTLTTIDSIAFESPTNQSTQNTFISNNTGCIVMNYRGVYQYAKDGKVTWKIETVGESFFQSIVQVTNGYILCGGIVQNDSLFNTLSFINIDGSIKWQRNFYSLQNSYVSICQALAYCNKHIYFMYADSNQIRADISGNGLVPSAKVVKIDLDGNSITETTVAVSPRSFVIKNNQPFLFGDVVDGTGQSLYRVYKIDTTTLTATLYFNNATNGLLPYGDKWLSVSSKNVRSADKLHKEFITSISVFDIIDTESIKTSYVQHYTNVFDTLTQVSSDINNLQLDGDNNILLTFTVNRKFTNGSGLLLYKIVLRKDTLPNVDSLWATQTTVAKQEVTISCQTLFKRTLLVTVWKKDNSSTIKTYVDTNIATNHAIRSFFSEPGEYVYTAYAIGGPYKDTITSNEHSFTVDAGTNGITQTNNDQLISVFPNPSNGSVVFEITIPGNLTVYTLEGKMVLNKNIQTTTPLDISVFGTGMYVYKFSTDKSTLTGKIIVQQ